MHRTSRAGRRHKSDRFVRRPGGASRTLFMDPFTPSRPEAAKESRRFSIEGDDRGSTLGDVFGSWEVWRNVGIGAAVGLYIALRSLWKEAKPLAGFWLAIAGVGGVVAGGGAGLLL